MSPAHERIRELIDRYHSAVGLPRTRYEEGDDHHGERIGDGGLVSGELRMRIGGAPVMFL